VPDAAVDAPKAHLCVCVCVVVWGRFESFCVS
jgi:hypothetical protein